MHNYQLWDHYKNGVIENELDTELEWAQSRKTSHSHGQPPYLFEHHNRTVESPFSLVMNETERNFKSSYKVRYPGGAWQLNQNGGNEFAIKTEASQEYLHTLISNCHLIYTEEVEPHRWLCGTECLTTQGFPVHPEFPEREGSILCSFNKLLPDPAKRHPRSVCGMAGNSMNVHVVGIVMSYGDMCIVNRRQYALNHLGPITLFTNMFNMSLAKSQKRGEHGGNDGTVGKLAGESGDNDVTEGGKSPSDRKKPRTNNTAGSSSG